MVVAAHAADIGAKTGWTAIYAGGVTNQYPLMTYSDENEAFVLVDRAMIATHANAKLILPGDKEGSLDLTLYSEAALRARAFLEVRQTGSAIALEIGLPQPGVSRVYADLNQTDPNAARGRERVLTLAATADDSFHLSMEIGLAHSSLDDLLIDAYCAAELLIERKQTSRDSFTLRVSGPDTMPRFCVRCVSDRELFNCGFLLGGRYAIASCGVSRVLRRVQPTVK